MSPQVLTSLLLALVRSIKPRPASPLAPSIDHTASTSSQTIDFFLGSVLGSYYSSSFLVSCLFFRHNSHSVWITYSSVYSWNFLFGHRLEWLFCTVLFVYRPDFFPPSFLLSFFLYVVFLVYCFSGAQRLCRLNLLPSPVLSVCLPLHLLWPLKRAFAYCSPFSPPPGFPGLFWQHPLW